MKIFLMLFTIGLINLNSFSQTKLIAHKSHSGTSATFHKAMLFDNNLATSDFGLPDDYDNEDELIDLNSIKRAPIYIKLDTLKYVSDSVSVMIKSFYNKNNLTEVIKFNHSISDTIYNHPLFTKKNALDSIKVLLKTTYNFKNNIDSVTFKGYNTVNKITIKENKKKGLTPTLSFTKTKTTRNIKAIGLSYLAYVFVVLGIMCIPFPFHLFPYQEKITTYFFGEIIAIVKPFLFKNSKYNMLGSDSSSLYTLLFILIGLAIGFTILFTHQKIKKTASYFIKIATIIIPYYLALMLLTYGVEKLLMKQFYKPEGNILFTPLGFLDSDILFWSTIGSAPIFNLFLGFFQVITAILLLFKNTRFFGLINALFIFATIVIINISFDISVKILSLFLFFTTIVGLFNYVSVFKTIITEIKIFNKKNTPFFKNTNFLYPFLKSFIILLFMFEVLYPYLKTYNTIKDKEFSNLVGSYVVTETLVNDVLIEKPKFKRIFIHKNKYLIFQDMNDKMTDYKLQINKEKSQFMITDYDLKKTFINYTYQNKKKISWCY